MRKNSIFCLSVFAALMIFLCGVISVGAETETDILPDGRYSAVFETDSTMFAVNEAFEGRGILTVSEGKMTIHVSLVSKNILNLYAGLAEDAQKEDAELLQPTEDEVTYSDGFKDTVYGFDIPVPQLDEPFDVALVGKKGKWYDHKVSVSDPLSLPAAELPADGEYLCEVTLQGGSGRASVESPALLTVSDGKVTARIIWSSPYYEYMLVDDVRFEPVQESGNSTFEVPVVLDADMAVSASTVAMSQPHLIDYTLHFDSATLTAAEPELQ